MPRKTKTAQEIREAEASASASSLVGRLGSLQAAVEGIEKADPDLAAEAMETQALADAAALVYDLRKRLEQVALAFVSAIGKAEGKTVGALSDGRQFTVSRSSDRKEWDHDDWKRDARRAITKRVTDELVDQDATVMVAGRADGEVWDVKVAALIQDALIQAQEVHGSTAPRSTSLKALGLWATDYCTSTPGPWRFTAVDPTPTTTTEES